ncbi:MAG: DEAD/DEAH box helicase [Pseudomonadota bacterium]|nr:DEAD/DEAH box helicase [Pseudomonadota bacterium]
MKLREWQEKAFPLWWEKKRGIIKVVTGGGKTFFAIHCLKRYLENDPQKSILIVVPSIALLDQWYDSLSQNFDDKEISLNGGGEQTKIITKICISTIDSLKNIISLIDAENSLLIVDECHKIGTEKRGEMLTNAWHATLGLSATPERDYDDNFYIIIKKILGDIIFDYDYIDAREDEVIVNFKLLYGYAALLPEEENKYKKFTKSIQRRAATIGGQDMNDYPLKMLIFNRARLVKNSKNRIPYGIELIQKYERDSWIVFTENKKQAKEFNKIVNKLKGFNSGIYNTDLNDDERQENLEKFKAGNLNVLVSCTALDEGFDMPEADGAMILSASSSKRQRIQRMGRVLRITANKENALIVTVYSSKTEYEKLREESNRYKLEGVPVKWQQMSL